MRSSSYLLVSLLALGLGCGRPRLIYDVDASFRRGGYRSVAVDPRKDRVLIRDGLRPLNPTLPLQAALVELDARHYRRVPAEEADLWLTVSILMPGQPELRRAPDREGGGEGRHGGGRGRGGPGQGGAPSGAHEGRGMGGLVLIVQMADRTSGHPVWQGELNLDPRDKGADGRPLSLEAAVHQLMQPLPALP